MQSTAYNAIPQSSDAPPTYFHVIESCKVAKARSKTPTEAVKNVLTGIFGSFLYTFYMLAYSVMPTLQILYGYPGVCSAQPQLPLWMTIYGSFGFAYVLINLLTSLMNAFSGRKKSDGPNRPTKVLNCFGSAVTLFLIGWFVYGNYLVISIYDQVQFTSFVSDDNSTTVAESNAGDLLTYCDKCVYMVAFWSITASYITVGLFCLCVFGIICFAYKK